MNNLSLEMRSLPLAGEMEFHLGKRAFVLGVNIKTQSSGLSNNTTAIIFRKRKYTPR